MVRFIFIFLCVLCSSIQHAYSSSTSLISSSFYALSIITWICTYIWLIQKLFSLKADPSLLYFTLKKLLAFLIAIVCVSIITFAFHGFPGFFIFVFGIFVVYGLVMALLNGDRIDFPFFFTRSLIYTARALLVLALCTGIFFGFALLQLETVFFMFPLFPWIVFGLGPCFLILQLHKRQSNSDTYEQIREIITIAALCVTLITVPYILDMLFEALYYR